MKTTRLFTLFAALALTISAYAYDFQSGDLYYNITSSTAPYTVEVTHQAYKSYTATYPNLTKVVIPSTVSYGGRTYSVTKIAWAAFYYCSSLTSVSIPNTVTSIQSDAFKYCSSLTSITIPSSVNDIGSWAFSNCRKLASVKIPESVTKIADLVFEYSGLTSVTIPESVTSIGFGAFMFTNLTSVTIPKGVTSIGKKAFRVNLQSPTVFSVVFNADSCADFEYYKDVETGEVSTVFYSLKSITIGNNVKRIPANFLRDVGFGRKLTIPESVKSIGANFLDRTNSFGIIVNCKSITPPTLATPLSSSVWTYVPCEALETYKTATNWENNTIYGSAFSEFKLTVNTNNNLGTAIQSPACDNIIVARSFRRSARPEVDSVGRFVQWNDGITENPRTINLTRDTTFTAEFIALFKVKTQVNNANLGQVTGEGLYDENSQATITALPKIGYHFVAWNDQNTDNPRTVNVTMDSTFTATFAVNTYSVSGSANDANMGKVIGGKAYEYNTQATIEAVANEGYGFVQWNDGNTQNPRTFTVTSDSAFVATFDAKYTISVTSADAVMGTVVGSGKFMNNTQTTIDATPNDGYAFVQWNDLNTENPRTILVTSDATYTATFMTITAIEQVTAETLNLRIENGTILCDGDMRIYDLIGRDVTHQNGLLQGVYMVRVDNLVVKVMVK